MILCEGSCFPFAGPGKRVRTLEKTIQPKSPPPPPPNKKRTFPNTALLHKLCLTFPSAPRLHGRLTSIIKNGFPKCLVCQKAPPPPPTFGGGGGGDSHMKKSGMLVGNVRFDPYEVQKRAWFKLFLPLKGTKTGSRPFHMGIPPPSPPRTSMTPV